MIHSPCSVPGGVFICPNVIQQSTLVVTSQLTFIIYYLQFFTGYILHKLVFYGLVSVVSFLAYFETF